MEHGFTWTEQWRNECEARYLLAMPLAQRRNWLAQLEEKRGDISALKNEMVRQWAKRKKS